jgi:hypothetical protein
MAKDVVFIGLLYFFFWELSVQFIAHLFSGLLILWEIGFLSSLYILVINPLQDVQVAKIFSHSVGCLFSLVTVSLAVQKLLVSCSPIY